MSSITHHLRRLAGFTPAGLILVGAAGMPHLACAASDTDVLQALSQVYSTALISKSAAEFCAAQAPANAAQAAQAYQAWRQRYDIVELVREFEATLPASQVQAQQRASSAIQDKLRQMGAPHQGCAGFIAGWSGADLDMRQKYPLAYRDDGHAVPLKTLMQRLRANQRSTSADDDERPARPLQPVRPVGTVYSLAQAYVLSEQWEAQATRDEAQRRMRTMGRLYVRGKVVNNNGSFFLQQMDDSFAARMVLRTGLNLASQEGQVITVGGVPNKLPNYFLYFDEPAIVQDVSGLRPSPLQEERGLRRLAVKPERIRTAPGQGVQMKDIVAVLHHGHNETGIGSGMEFKEDIHLLLRDGTAYEGTEVPPADLDVKASKALEPQHWMRWEAVRRGRYRVLKQDDRGRPEAKWTELDGTPIRPWRPGERLNGTFKTQHFYGTLMGGATSTKNFVVFKPDGRFETIGFALSSTGSMQAGSGFSGSSSAHSDGKGSSSSAGASGGGAGAYSQGRKNDGDEHRGTYHFDGYTLALQFDSGDSGRLFSFAWDDTIKYVYLMGESYRTTRDE